MGAYNIINPANLVAGQLENVGDVLANLQAIQAIINGGIDNSNINAAAAILASKLAAYPTDPTKVLAGDGTWPGGIVKLSDTILGAPAATIDITGISSAFRHLKVVASLRCDQAATSAGALLRVNGDSTATYADGMWQFSSSGSGGESNSATSWNFLGANGTGATAGYFWDQELMLPNYSRTDRAKSYMALHAIPFNLLTIGHLTRMGSGIWNSFAAINRLTFSLATGNFTAGSTVSIYGIG